MNFERNRRNRFRWIFNWCADYRSCNQAETRLEIHLAERTNGRKRSPVTKSRAPLSADGLNDLLIQLARVRKATTRTINVEFKKVMGKKIRKLDKREQRAQKVQWLKAQLGKGKAA